jgi:hypothetical protein
MSEIFKKRSENQNPEKTENNEIPRKREKVTHRINLPN